MKYNKLVACVSAAVLAGAIACSNNSDNPISPSAAQPGAAAAGPSGETLKATAPTPQSPVNNQQPQGFLTLVAGKATSPFSNSSAAFEYEFEIRRGGNSVAGCTQTVPGGPNAAVSYSPTCSLEFDQAYSWRVRAVFQGRHGPWSSDATFRAPAGGFFRNNEFFDPLTSGTTVGQPAGVTFIPGVGARMDGFTSKIMYVLDTNLQAGEFSLMTTGVDEGNDGDKTKIMSMQEGFGDLTTNDYRMTVEKRGRRYETPGAVTWRLIMGDSDEHNGRIFDGTRLGISFSDEKWYFWKFTWGNGRAELVVREDGPEGPVIYNTSRGTGGFAYRPVPHVVHIGAPSGRAGEGDATVPGMVVKNVWFSASPRPNGI
jgi:hypothetical protein